MRGVVELYDLHRAVLETRGTLMAIDLHKAQTVILFLPYADPVGIRVAMVQMSTIHAIAFPAHDPRIHEPEFANQLARPGIYLLVGLRNDQPIVRIGQSENVSKRLGEHRQAANLAAKKSDGPTVDTEEKSIYPYWETTLAFTSKDETLTTGHIRFIEGRLTKLASGNPEIQVLKGQIPSEGAGGLPLYERATCEAFIGQVALISGVLGHDYFIATESATLNSEQKDVAGGASVGDPLTAAGGSYETFQYENGGILAKMVSDGATVFRILKGSSARLNEAPALSAATKALRKNLLSTGILNLSGDKYVFQQDQEFKTISSATGTITGSTDWGNRAWRLPQQDIDLGEWLETQRN